MSVQRLGESSSEVPTVVQVASFASLVGRQGRGAAVPQHLVDAAVSGRGHDDSHRSPLRS